MFYFFATNKCRAAFTESNTCSSTHSGNNVGACCLIFAVAVFGLQLHFSAHAIYLTFAELGFSGVKSLSRKKKKKKKSQLKKKKIKKEIKKGNC
jgi:ADP-ribosylglycohydrolase